MIDSNKLNNENSGDEKEIPLIRFKQIESENEAEWEENDPTEADSGIQQSLILMNNTELKIKKNKGFETFFERPLTKNFLNGGDFSDFFNNQDTNEEKNSNGKNNNKKFHTFTSKKKSSISSQLRKILNEKDKEDESILY